MRTSLYSPRAEGRFRSRASLNATATLAVLAAPSLAQAQIVWSGLLNTTVNAGSPQTLLDFNQNTTPDNEEAYLTLTEFKGDNYLNVSGITSAKIDPSIAFLHQGNSLAFGATIDSSLNYVGEHAIDLVPANGATYYYAFAYQAAGGPYYGWMELSFSTDTQTGTLHQWAFNSVAGESLTAGQTSAIPEPATMGALLGVAALGASAWWRRRSNSARA